MKIMSFVREVTDPGVGAALLSGSVWNGRPVSDPEQGRLSVLAAHQTVLGSANNADALSPAPETVLELVWGAA